MNLMKRKEKYLISNLYYNMENYYYFVKNIYKIEPKFNFTEEITNDIKVYSYKGACIYDGISFKTEICLDTDIVKDFDQESRIAYSTMSILLLIQLNNKIHDYIKK